MGRFAILASAALLAVGQGVELSAATWDEATAGKSVFLKFFAPWCGHCKSMKPAWDKLMKAYDGHKTTLIADVDCVGEGKDLCSTHGVRGYPTIKYGDPADLQDYKGGREYKDLDTFAQELGPMCSPGNVELCDDAKKAQIKEFQALSSAERQAQIKAKEAELKALETGFEEMVKGLQKKYEEGDKKKNDEIKAIKDGGLGLLKAVEIEAKKQGGSSASEL